ncbi:MAG: hypothetical protein RMN51_02080 [Verrucomicrobiota bacterium]|nr:hypothetical protein [Limisphaera sp.]MDW8380886.1 hypothetical protein [Verrucomicrobiota bacterium]
MSVLALFRSQAADPPFRVRVVESGSGWPVPLVELRTTHHMRWITDNTGLAALNAPELMHREVWLFVQGPGYSVVPDGFGMRGLRVRPTPGSTVTIEVQRNIVARRLGRLTGGGLFGESSLCGEFRERVANDVWGCDSVQIALHRGQLFWVWGDTTLPHYPLGIFHATAARTSTNPISRPEPPIWIMYQMITNADGRPRAVAQMPGDGPTWLSGLVSIPDRSGQPRLVATYAKIKPPLEVYRWGLCVWNENDSTFEPLKVIWTRSELSSQAPPVPDGHAVPWRDDQGRSWILFGNPFPFLRCPATFEAWQDPASWEILKPPEALTSAEGHRVQPHSGSIAWHPWLKRWIAVFVERYGKPSAFGEVWYAEADHPLGPWGRAVKILSHDNYTFYNPRIHAETFRPEAPVLLFEGTYSREFADRPEPTPRYDYNQVLYRLDLDDPRLQPARK